MQRISQGFAWSFHMLARSSIRYVYKLAKEAIVYVYPPRKTTCTICLNDNIDINQMFCVEKCRHEFCSKCVRRHIEVRLPEGSVIRCPAYRCKSELTCESCANLLTPKLIKMWQERIKDDSIPINERVYCPNPRCSALMSLDELSKPVKEDEVRRKCFECNQLLCIKCKVPWHIDLSCGDYKRLGPNPNVNDMKFKGLANRKRWRECGKCERTIELSEGCIKVTCICGHKFCYQCGAKAGGCRHGAYHIYLPTPQLPYITS
ncbi:hypothetical protein CARUB_v10019116mg [Capsella rubella]|uniref:RBR-type E3 ubiquitin transferase n=1 Tax=Capsella rubella TaxID=81985 RepID=R0HKK5_9BRAS|nr:probable E3 ubiquitin-protein ligase RNF144A [Capsella rubella]EOA25755.1 hypothetical protein CARUB_v10019116mg [Capsella rubella]